MNIPCVNCLTYVMCKHRLVTKLKRNLFSHDRLYAIWASYGYMVRQVNCEEGQTYIKEIFGFLYEMKVPNRHEFVVNEIINAFNLKPLDYKGIEG